MLGGWLHRQTCFLAYSALRAKRRRERREKQAVEMNALQAPAQSTWHQVGAVLDEAIEGLNTPDRTAIILRFFEGRDLRSIGVALGTNEDAAQKRVSRAVEKLRHALVRRGVTLSTATLGSFLTGHAVTAAPAGIVVSIATVALAGAEISSGLSALKFMVMSKLKIGVASAIVVAGVATPLIIQRHSITELRRENSALQAQAVELPNLRRENQRMANLAVDADELAHLRQEHGELLRLRGEAGMLRSENRRLARVEQENQRLRNSLANGSQQERKEAPATDFLLSDNWTDLGLATPDTAVQTWLWALRNGNAERYMQLRGKAGTGPEASVPWRKEMMEVKASRVTSQETKGPDEVLVWLEYQTHSGGSEHGALGLRWSGTQWEVKQVIGFPIRLIKGE